MSYCADLALEVYLPNGDAFVLDSSRLDQTDKLGPVSGGDYVWTELITDTSQVYISRGADPSLGVFARAEAGEMSFTYWEDNFNPFYRDTIDPNSPVRLTVAGVVLFSGVVKSVDAQFVKDGPTAINIVCVDDVARLNREIHPTYTFETFERRLEQWALDANVPTLTDPRENWTWVLNDAAGQVSYWDQLFMSTNSIGGFASMLRDGRVYVFSTTRGADPLIKFSDVHDEADPKHSCFSELSFAYDTTATVNDLTLNNHKAVLENGEWNDVNTRYSYEDSNSIQGYGRASKSADTNLADVSNLNLLAADVFARFNAPKKRVKTITFPVESYDHAAVDFNDLVSVTLKDNILEETKFSIIGIEHEIEPDRWVVKLNLIAN